MSPTGKKMPGSGINPGNGEASAVHNDRYEVSN
jgi:hypothetical protein